MNIIPFRHKRRQASARPAEEPGIMTRVRDEMERIFGCALDGPWRRGGDSAMSAWIPRIDLSETDDQITLRVDLPGIDPKDITVTVSGNLLTVAGERRQESEHQGEEYYQCERSFGSFSRTIELPANADPESIEAEERTGVLTVRMSKIAGKTPRRIHVKQPAERPRERVPAGV
jgi:HSP20 family protein